MLISVKIEHVNASLYTVLILTEMQPDTKAHPSIIDLKSKTKKDQPLAVWFLREKNHIWMNLQVMVRAHVALPV